MHTETEHQGITPTESVVPVYLVPLTAEELQARAEAVALEEQRTAEDIARAEARLAGLAKLVALGLTDQEALAFVGD